MVLTKDAHKPLDHNDVMLAYQQLSPVARMEFDQAPAVRPSGFKTTHASPIAKFVSTHFSLSDATKWGCFVHASRLNHSCSPNCYMSPVSADTMQCYVIRDVAAGEELTFAYHDAVLFLPTDQRHEMIKIKGLGFSNCLCELCSKPAAERGLSDLRRNLLRHILYVVYKRDVGEDLSTLLSDLCRNGALRIEYCVKNRVFQPLGLLLIKLAEAEDVRTSFWLRVAYLEMALTDSDDPSSDVGTMMVWLREAVRLKLNCTGTECATPAEAEFVKRVALVIARWASRAGGLDVLHAALHLGQM